MKKKILSVLSCLFILLSFLIFQGTSEAANLAVIWRNDCSVPTYNENTRARVTKLIQSFYGDYFNVKYYRLPDSYMDDGHSPDKEPWNAWARDNGMDVVLIIRIGRVRVSHIDFRSNYKQYDHADVKDVSVPVSFWMYDNGSYKFNSGGAGGEIRGKTSSTESLIQDCFIKSMEWDIRSLSRFVPYEYNKFQQNEDRLNHTGNYTEYY